MAADMSFLYHASFSWASPRKYGGDPRSERRRRKQPAPASPKMISPARTEDRLRVFNVPSAPGIARYHAMNDADMGVRTCTTWVK